MARPILLALAAALAACDTAVSDLTPLLGDYEAVELPVIAPTDGVYDLVEAGGHLRFTLHPDGLVSGRALDPFRFYDAGPPAEVAVAGTWAEAGGRVDLDLDSYAATLDWNPAERTLTSPGVARRLPRTVFRQIRP